jgi:NitT/TauT family transport system permease protein
VFDIENIPVLIIYREESLCTYAKRRSMPFLSLGHSQRISRWRAAVAWQISPRWRALATAGLSVAAFVVLWQIASARDDTILFPGPVATVKAVLALLNEGVLSLDVRVSLVRIGVGFAVGVVVGVPLGLAMGTFPPVKIFFEPYIQFLRFVPAIAWLVPAILWFGIGELSKIFLIVYTTVFLVMLNTMVGVASVRRNQIRAAQCFGAGPWQRYAWVILPATMPYILTGMRLAMGNSFAAVVGAELIAADHGIGFLIMDSWMWMAADKMFAGMLTLGLLGVLADLLFQAITILFAQRYLMTG